MNARRLLACLLALPLLCVGASARAEKLVVALSNHTVRINSSFTGAELVLFGAVEHEATTLRRAYDLVATVTGPRQDIVTFRKERVVGIWVNVESRTFWQAPAYLAVLSNRPLAAIAGDDVMRRLDLGLSDVLLEGEETRDPWSDPFRTAFVNINRSHGLYREEPAAVKFLTPELFRANLALPANVPLGTYEVVVRLFADGAVLARQSAALAIEKVGFEQFVANAAREHGVLYGVATVMLAMLTGWFGSVVFRRD